MKAVSEKSRNNAGRSISFKTIDRTRLYEAIAQPRYSFTGNGQRVMPRQVASGTYRGQQKVGTENLQINSSEGNILVRDSGTNRLIMGIQQNGF